jgi:hypothetical protein
MRTGQIVHTIKVFRYRIAEYGDRASIRRLTAFTASKTMDDVETTISTYE